MLYCDFHSHILPEIDDGSRSVEESLAMLKKEEEDGVKVVVATPHFYAEHDSLDSFLERREIAEKKLSEALIDSAIKVCVGAEVAYFYGISRTERISSLCIKGTSVILIEMPFAHWGKEVVQELIDLKENGGVIPVIAHFERFLPYRNDRAICFLADNGCILQSNGEFFLDKNTSKKALKWFSGRWIGLIGSDCHNLENRIPNIGKTAELIFRTFGDEAIDDINDLSTNLLMKANKI